MSITRDLRGYADTALEQGRQVLGQAQSQLNDVTGQANEFVSDLRAQAEKALNLDAIKTAVEPYLAQAKGYRHSVTDRAEALINTAKKDPRVAKAFVTAEQLTGVVVETVQQRLVQPVWTFTGRDGKPAASKPAAKPATKAAAKPATKAAAKPATTRSANKSTTAAARKPAARKASTTKASKADNA
ncbi:MAG TPA: hypothetical protein VFT67_17215 [Jatrophihabitantaceae bacterium]|jgi:hypothetical protein|nr:hypothetical protein [Jatrophihabitantaceae bacterium]